MFIVTKTIDSDNISKVCRTCLREDNDKMVCLFIGPPQSSLGAKLQSLSGLEILHGDGLPEKMCDRCVTRAESAILFREQCRAADQALRQAAIQLSIAKYHRNVPTYEAYQQNESYVPFQYTQGTPNYNDYRTFSSRQDLVHNRWYSSFYPREENTSQHMHIIDSHNTYLNLSCYGNGLADQEILTDRAPSMITSDLEPFTRYNSVYNTNPIYSTNSVYNTTSLELQCSFCNYTFTNETQFVNHSIIHTSDNLSNDEINIEVEENSNNAERNVSDEIMIQTPPVEQPIDQIEYLKTNSINNSSFQQLNFTNASSENNSEKLNTNNSSEVPESELTSYSTSAILKKNTFKCNICCRLFSQKSKLSTHQLTHNRKKSFECFHCGKTYSSKHKLYAHTRLHTKTNIHQCTVCQKIFSYPSYLNDHMKTHNAKPVEKKFAYECVQCKKQFRFATSYKGHMKFHTGKGLFHCDICDKLFNRKYLLKLHMRSHESIKLYKCNLCNKSFNLKSNLVEHERTHTKIKPFKCKICDKSFAQSSHLKSHEVSHDSTRKFQCKICEMGFKLASHLKRHVKQHTGLKLYKCDQCDQMFTQSFSKKRHMKKHMESNL